MRALILPDADVLSREHALLARLEIGLADEGVRVFHGVPRARVDDTEAWDAPGVYSRAMPYTAAGLPLTLPVRSAAFVRMLERAVAGEGGKSSAETASTAARAVDVVHCFGAGSMRFGLALARRCGSAALLEVWNRAGVHAAGRALRRSGLGGRAMALAPDVRLFEYAQSVLGKKRVQLTPWGVHASEPGPPRVRRAGEPLTVALVVSAEPAGQTEAAVRDVRAALQGVAFAAAKRPELLVFADAAAALRTPLARWARELGIESTLTLIPDMESRRELVLQADVMLVPQALGEQRTIVLDALGAGMLVAAQRDELVEAIDARTGALVLARSDAQAWAAALVGAGWSAERAAAGRRYVLEERPAYAHALAVVRAYAQIADARSELNEAVAQQSRSAASRARAAAARLTGARP
ncbi:hypothetical protein BH11PLA1_BH11PLA1_14040 [soil metagenome]